jgi:hypothetical protein
VLVHYVVRNRKSTHSRQSRVVHIYQLTSILIYLFILVITHKQTAFYQSPILHTFSFSQAPTALKSPLIISRHSPFTILRSMRKLACLPFRITRVSHCSILHHTFALRPILIESPIDSTVKLSSDLLSYAMDTSKDALNTLYTIF